MRLLLDTNIVLPLVEERSLGLPQPIRDVLGAERNTLLVSVASLWEIAIKVRIGKLPLRSPLSGLAAAIERAGPSIVSIEASHAVALVSPEPDTKDPFDRLLLAQCQVEAMQLVTLDRTLADHPLAWRP